jgi:hypothetical protein
LDPASAATSIVRCNGFYKADGSFDKESFEAAAPVAGELAFTPIQQLLTLPCEWTRSGGDVDAKNNFE